MVCLWALQFRAFIWKIFLQQLRAPVLTILELCIPCIFMLVLSLGYLNSNTQQFSGTDISYNQMIGNINMNMTSFFTSVFCQNTTHPRPFGQRLPLPSCQPQKKDVLCIPNVRQGALCVQDVGYASEIRDFVYASGVPTSVPSLDVYLAFSALATYERNKKNLKYFGPSSWASFTHYGHLLIAVTDGNESVGRDFAKFCAEASVLCGEVVYTERIFASMDAAQKFAKKKSGEVWAIVELSSPSLPSSSSSSTIDKEDDVSKGKIFTISMNYTATPTTFDPKTSLSSWAGTSKQSLYVNSGFLTLQNLVHQFYLHQRIKNVTRVSSSGANFSDILRYVNLDGPSLMAMPFPSYTQNDFYYMWSYFLPLISVLTAVFPVARLASWIVEEKSLRIRESMHIMGLRWSCMAVGWYVSALLMHFIVTCLVTVIMKTSFFRAVHYGVLFCLYFTFTHQNIALALFLSTFFTNPRLAGIVGAMCVFICSVPFYFFPDGMSRIRLLALCFAPCIAYTKSFETLAMYISFGRGFGWEDMFKGEFAVAVAIGLMWASSFILLILAVYFDHVFPSSIGRRLHPLFFISSLRNLFFCCCRTKNTGNEKPPLPQRDLCADDSTAGCPFVPAGKNTELADNSKSSYAAVFCNLSRVYETGGVIGWFYYFFTGLHRDGDYCEALRDVSFKLEFGKINVLVGENGSGKSTLLGIATGMLEPTSGEVYICGHDAKVNLGSCRKHIGYCPQSDILWGSLTVEEHLLFYARMKKVANGRWDVKEHVDKIIASMQLEEERNTAARCLSSGQRRRLCVGIALIGDPRVLFLDEPTTGMDVKSKKAVYSALKQDNTKRAVLISTHLLGDADCVGDRVLLLQDGVLRCAGQPLFLKSMVGFGYVLTCVVEACASETEENMLISKLTSFVRATSCAGHLSATAENAEGSDADGPRPISSRCKLLGVERRGREISFRFSFSLLSSTDDNLICQLEEQRERLRLCSIGLSFTTLQDVMDLVTNPRRRRQLRQTSTLAVGGGAFNSGSGNMGNGDCFNVEQGISIEMEGCNVTTGAASLATENSENADLGMVDFVLETNKRRDENAASFGKHFVVLFMKRVLCAKRDFRFLFFQIMLPLFFLCVAFLTDYIDPQTQPPLVLDASLYPGYREKPYKSMMWATSSALPDVFGVIGKDMSTAFGPYYTPVHVSCTLTSCSDSLFFAMLDNLKNHTADFFFALSLASLQAASGSTGVPRSGVMYNISAYHSAPQGLNALYNVVNHQLFGKGTTVTARNQPMEMGLFEKKPVTPLSHMVFAVLVMLPFTFIPSNMIGYIVRENQSGSRHLQWLAGANSWAFWLSSMLFDFCCYLVTELLALPVFLLFKRTEFVGGLQEVGATLSLFSMFGLSTIVFGYVLTYFFRSPFLAQSVVLVANFVVGFLWTMSEQILGGIESFEVFVTYAAYVFRIVPAVSFCEGVFVFSGIYYNDELSFSGRKRPELYSLLNLEGGVFVGGIGTALIYMSCTFIGSLLLLAVFEYTRVRRCSWSFTKLFFSRALCKGSDKDAGNRDSSVPPGSAVSIAGVCDSNDRGADESVLREETEVCAAPRGRAEDQITSQHITKKYSTADRFVLDDLSFGVHKGEVMALLGLNGSGKTTTVAILAGDVMPTSGAVYINHLPISNLASRTYLGYCPQNDALIDHLSPYEHLCLYATLRGTEDTCIHKEVQQLIDALGLGALWNTPAYALSGGNKRRLSLAIALVGGTTSLLLDEPTAGMDPAARRQTCALIKRLIKQKSVIFTTHLIYESEALADRVAFISKGKLRCIGTQREVKAHFTNDAVYIVSVVFAGENVSDDVTSRLCECFGANDGQEGKRCVLEDVVGRTVTLSVQERLSRICAVADALREGKVAGLPAVTQVCATQPTLEDILLRL